ncbi:rod shape-determining protein RodA [Candidatus Thiodubiliella endoseptemdiera]|uniref:Peptidoglycan glycosyltransferase MrdB n=2 Tax=Candidatus Thiodubiliella endoseptemdiera TaxID=2738886 RepID=A0A853F002_9GAMM|nr:rod shape-determining protein RodA [Candidatus Thiodubiliella endoseptemdiera]
MIMTQIDKLRHYWHYFKMDTPLFLMLMGISIFGLTILYSASAESIFLVYKQMLHFIFAIGVMLIIAQIPPRVFRRYSPYLMLLGIFLLLLVLLFGSSSGGAQRWLDLGLIRFQPSELMKVIVPIAIASILSEKTLPPQPISIFTSLAAIIVIVLLIAKQPDLGTSLLIGASGGYVLLFSGVRIQILRNSWLNFGVISAGSLGGGYIAWNYLLMAYQKKRIMTMIDPTLDPLGAGYHILQSKIAIGSGGLFGKGIEQGSQAQLNFLPEHTTDFIFAVIAEELGFIGVLLLLCFYGLIIWRCFVISIESEDTFSKLLGASLTLIFFTYVFVNIGMVSGLLPVVGVPLPLISYGGSSLITLFASFGIIMSIRKHKIPGYLS